MVMKQPVEVYFDGTCPLCRREINFMRRLDWNKRLEFVDVSDPTAEEHCPIDRADLMERFHVRAASGRLESGAVAFAAMWRVMPLTMPFGHLARIPPVLWGLERLYRVFLRLRPRLQRLFSEKPEHAST